jgi:endonuclease-3
MNKTINYSKRIYNSLDLLIESPKSELKFNNEFELLVAVMLSAQCTDKRVNMVTERLFDVYKTPMDFAKLKIEDLEFYIKSCNYYHNKAKNIIEASKEIMARFGGIVPRTHEELVSLPGVGNKTANVVQAVAFGQQALPVDTHILRVSNRLGIVDTNSPDKCEQVLKIYFNGYNFAKLHHLLLLFGRYYCKSRNPECNNCVLSDICKFRGIKE